MWDAVANLLFLNQGRQHTLFADGSALEWWTSSSWQWSSARQYFRFNAPSSLLNSHQQWQWWRAVIGWCHRDNDSNNAENEPATGTGGDGGGEGQYLIIFERILEEGEEVDSVVSNVWDGRLRATLIGQYCGQWRCILNFPQPQAPHHRHCCRWGHVDV